MIFVFPVALSTIPTDAGVAGPKYKTAVCLPFASGCGYVSMPSPLVICLGAPPDVETAQMWRRSMSFAFVEYTNVLPSGEMVYIVLSSIKPLVGVRRTGCDVPFTLSE